MYTNLVKCIRVNIAIQLTPLKHLDHFNPTSYSGHLHSLYMEGVLPPRVESNFYKNVVPFKIYETILKFKNRLFPLPISGLYLLFLKLPSCIISIQPEAVPFTSL